MGNSIKSGINKVQARLSSFGYQDFSGKELFDAATYTLRKPGKMLRPALVLLGAKLMGEDAADFIDMAVAAELLHTASLVHDDIIDGDSVRRGVPTLHAKRGSEVALLSGDALIAKAVSLASRYGPRVVKKVADASLDMCAGELLDYSSQREGKPIGVREYLRVARLKNGVFMGTCASAAAIYKRKKVASRLYGFGLGLGVAFQIRDDILELVDEKEAGRNGGSKITSGYTNIVRIFAKQFGIGQDEAVKKAVGLNDYFADRALHFMEGATWSRELSRYIDFVRVRGA